MNSSGKTLDEPLEDCNEKTAPSLVDGATFTKLDSNNSGMPSSNPGYLTVDAVHPFFTSYRNIEHYHCRECNEDFETCPKSLKLHFVNRRHTAVASCTYCHLPVYEYVHNGNCLYYHRCDEEVTESMRGNDVDVSDSLLTSSTLDGSCNNISQCSDTTNLSVSDASINNTSI